MKDVEVRTEAVPNTPMTRYKIYYKDTLIRAQLSKPDEEDLVWLVNKHRFGDKPPPIRAQPTMLAMGNGTAEGLAKARTNGIQKLNRQKPKP